MDNNNTDSPKKSYFNINGGKIVIYRYRRRKQLKRERQTAS